MRPSEVQIVLKLPLNLLPFLNQFWIERIVCDLCHVICNFVSQSIVAWPSSRCSKLPCMRFDFGYFMIGTLVCLEKTFQQIRIRKTFQGRHVMTRFQQSIVYWLSVTNFVIENLSCKKTKACNLATFWMTTNHPSRQEGRHPGHPAWSSGWLLECPPPASLHVDISFEAIWHFKCWIDFFLMNEELLLVPSCLSNCKTLGMSHVKMSH